MKITSEYCRVCLKNSSVFNEETNSFESFSIYKKDENNLSFADKLQHLTRFDIPRNIPLAKRICKECSITLNSAYTLIKQCEENERIIRNYLVKNNLNQQCNDSILDNGKIKNNLFQQQFDDSIKSSNEGKSRIKIEAILDTSSELLASDNEVDYKNENEDEFEEEHDYKQKTTEIEISPIIKKVKSDSDFDVHDDDNDRDFTVDDVGESVSDTDGSDSDYAPRSKRPSLKMVSFAKARKISLKPFSNNGSRPIKLNLVRGLKLKTASNNSKTVRSEIIGGGADSTEGIENDHKSDDEESKTKVSIRTNPLKNRQLIKLIPCKRFIDTKTNTNVNQNVGRKTIYLKPKKSADCKATVCPICGKMYQSGDTMRGHMKWHENNEECFKCDICGKGFDNPSYLKCHKKIHSNRPTPYTCEVCGKAFFHPNKLRLHTQYAHTDERLKCPHCDVTVKYPSSLKRHLSTHTEIRNFECIDCSKTFRSRSNLNQHLESKFHSTKEIQPMVRIKGIAEQYVPGPPRPSYTKKRRSQIKKERGSQKEFQIPEDQTVESIETSQITYEDYENEAQIAGNYLINTFAPFSENKIE